MPTSECVACTAPMRSLQQAQWLMGAREVPGWLECAGCGTVQVHPIPGTGQLRRWYTTESLSEGTGTVGPPSSWKRWALRQLVRAWPSSHPRDRAWRWLLDPLASHFQGLPSTASAGASAGHILDVGCGDGLLLAILRDVGWTVDGIEMDPRRAAIARGHGIPVWVGDLHDYTADGPSFTTVRFWHVLEHLPDPRQALRLARHRWLQPGGELIVGVPNIQSAMHRIFGTRWAGLQIPKHLFHFTEPGIRRMVESAGFIHVRVAHRSCGTVLDSLPLIWGRPGGLIARLPPVRLTSIYVDRILDRLEVGDAFEVRAVAPLL